MHYLNLSLTIESHLHSTDIFNWQKLTLSGYRCFLKISSNRLLSVAAIGQIYANKVCKHTEQNRAHLENIYCEYCDNMSHAITEKNINNQIRRVDPEDKHWCKLDGWRAMDETDVTEIQNILYFKKHHGLLAYTASMERIIIRSF